MPYDPHSAAFLRQVEAAKESLAWDAEHRTDRSPFVILKYFGSGENAPSFRTLRETDWERSRSEASNAAWTPVARVELDATVVPLI